MRFTARCYVPGTPLTDATSHSQMAGPSALARFTVFLLPVLAVGGSYLSVIALPGVNLFAFRLAVLAFAVVPLLFHPRLWWLRDVPIRAYALLGALWVFWGTMTALWAADIQAAIVDTLAVAFGFLTALALVNLRANTWEGLQWLLRGWVAGALVAAAIALWELWTGQHLPGPWVEGKPAYILRFITIATFGNPNNYGAFLLLITPILLFQLETSQSRALRWMLFLFLLAMIVLSVLTTGKVGVIGIVVVLGVYMLWVARHKLIAVTIAVALAVGGTAAFTYLARDVPLLEELVVLGEQGVYLEGSSLVRVNLVRAGVDMTGETYGFGVGGGNFRYLMEHGHKDYWTGHIVDPHNWWIEVLSQYGIVVFSAYIAFVAYVFFVSRKMTYHGRGRGARFLRLFIVAFVLAGFANSGYVLQATNWLFMATILMMVSTLKRTALETNGAS